MKIVKLLLALSVSLGPTILVLFLCQHFYYPQKWPAVSVAIVAGPLGLLICMKNEPSKIYRLLCVLVVACALTWALVRGGMVVALLSGDVL